MADKEQRQRELEALDWQGIKKIAQQSGIEKSENEEWKDVIPQILEKQSEAAEPMAVKYIPASPDVEPAEPVAINTEQAYPSSFYKSAGINYCPECGEKKRTRANKPFCPQDRTDCPMLTGVT